MDEYTNLDMLKSLVKTVELLTEENKELRNEIKSLRTSPAMWLNQQDLPPIDLRGYVSKD